MITKVEKATFLGLYNFMYIFYERNYSNYRMKFWQDNFISTDVGVPVQVKWGIAPDGLTRRTVRYDLLQVDPTQPIRYTNRVIG